MKAIALVFVALAFFSCNSQTTTPLIGVCINKTYIPGVKLAVEEINRQGGIHGRPLALAGAEQPLDPLAEANVLLTHMDFLLQNPHVLAVVGPSDSASAFSVLSIIGSLEIPHIMTTPTNPGLVGLGTTSFRLCLSDAQQGPQLARHALTWGKSRAVVLYTLDDYGRHLSHLFEQHFEAGGGQVLGSLYHHSRLVHPNDLEVLQSELGRWTREGFGGQKDVLVLLCREPFAGLVLPMLGKYNCAVDLLAADDLAAGSFLRAAGHHPARTRVSLFYDANHPGEENRSFQQQFRARTGQLPDHGNAYAYEAVLLLATAMRQEGLSRAGIRRYLARMVRDQTPFTGVTGEFTLQPHGDAQRAFLVGEARDGVWVPLRQETVDPPPARELP